MTEIFLEGRLTFADHERFRQIIASFNGLSGDRLIFDLSGLEFVDSSGMGMFIVARDTAEKRNLSFSLRAPRDDVKRLLTLAKFHRVFSIIE